MDDDEEDGEAKFTVRNTEEGRRAMSTAWRMRLRAKTRRETRARRRRMSFIRKDTSRCRNRRREGDDRHRRHTIVIIIGVTNIGLHRLRITDAGLRRTIGTVRLRMVADRLHTVTDRRLHTVTVPRRLLLVTALRLLRMGTDRLLPVTDIRRRLCIASATCLRLLACLRAVRLRAVRLPRIARRRTTTVNQSPLNCLRLRRQCHRRRRRTPYHSST